MESGALFPVDVAPAAPPDEVAAVEASMIWSVLSREPQTCQLGTHEKQKRR